MRPSDAADLIRRNVESPWHDVRAAGVQRRVVDAMREPVRSGAPRALGPKRRALAWLAAAAALVLVVAFAVRRWTSSDLVRLELSDGSVATLDASARVVPEVVTPERIELRQTAGSVSYDVAPDPARTFVVHVDDARVEVIGTAFRVERIEQAIRVVVSRGRVRVVHGARLVTLGAGEEITLSNVPSSDLAAVANDAEQSEAPPGSSAASPVASTAASASSSARPEEPSAAELFRRADDARAAGDGASALRHLRELIAKHPRDGRVTMATFTIGRLESQRGSYVAAANAFEACGASFQGEALAEAALARSAAGQSGQAKGLARRYLQLFPDGPRQKAMSALAQ